MAIDLKRVKEIFLEAADLPDEASRTAYLDRACGGDAGLRGRVEALLRSHDPAGSFLGTPAAVVPDPNGLESDETMALEHTPVSTDDGSTPGGSTHGGDKTHSKEDDEPDDLHFLLPSTRTDSLGRLGHYEMLQVLGKGAFGIVFRAFDDVLQRVVAVKVMAPQLAATSPARKRFLREARSSAQVRHENVVQIYEVGEQPLPYLTMEFIPGETLQQKLDRTGPLEVPEVMRIGRQIAEGLAAAHACERILIHRDIKPSNVLLEGGSHKAKITDFGLARAADDASISQSGIIAGTPMYMAPEQAKGEKLDQRADLFSLGSVLYQMVAGRPPFRANSTVAVLKRVAEDTPRDIREIIPETPQWLCDIIAKLHAKDRDERFQSAREVADLLADCEAQLKANSKLTDYTRIPRGQARPSGRRKWVAVAAMLLLPVLALAMTEFAGVTHLFQKQQQNLVAQPKEGPEAELEAPTGRFALAFDGVKSWARIPSLVIKEDHPLTVEAWTVLEDLVAPNRHCDLVANTGSGGFSLGIPPEGRGGEGKKWAFVAFSETTRGYAQAWEKQPVPRHQPVHLAGVYDGKGELRFYVNGQLQSRTVIEKMKPAPWSVVLGGSQSATGRMHGRISEVRISKVARYDNDFTPDTRFGPDKDTIALYHFDEGEGAVLKDSSGDGHHGQIHDAKWVKADGSPISDDWKWIEPVNLGPAVNSRWTEWEPFMSRDGRTLLFGSDRPGGEGGLDLWQSTRKNVNDPWSTPVPLGSAINSSDREHSPRLSQDGLTLVFTSDRPGGHGGNDLWMSSRKSVDQPWGSPINLGPLVNSPEIEEGPCLSADGLTLLFASGRGGGEGFVDLWMCQRKSANDPWSAPLALGPQVNSAKWDGNPFLLGDGLTLVFQSSRSGKDQLWKSTRKTVQDSWSPATNFSVEIGLVNQFKDAAPSFSADGKTMLFSSTRPGGQGRYDIWMTQRAPKDESPIDQLPVANEGPVPKKTLLGFPGRVVNATYSSDGRLLAAAGDGAVRVFDAESGELRYALKVSPKARYYAVTFSPDSRHLLTAPEAGSDDFSISIWEANTGEPVGTLEGHEKGLFELSFSADGNTLLSCGRFPIVGVWDFAKRRKLLDIPAERDKWARSAVISSQGKVAFGAYTVSVAEANGTLIQTIEKPAGPLCFSRDGKQLAGTTWREGVVTVWDVETGNEIASWRAHEGTANGVAFSRDGNILVTAGGDGKVRFWDVNTQRELAVLSHDKEAYWVAFSPDGQTLATTGFDQVVKLWDVSAILAGHSKLKAMPPTVAPFTDADVRRIGALPAAEQVDEVRKELMRRNPGFDGTMQHKIEGDVVTEIKIPTDYVTDISPIRVWNALRNLDCSGTTTNHKPNGQLANLPLEGMNLTGLTRLNLGNTRVGDAGLKHFQGCTNLLSLHLHATQVGDAGLANFKDCKNLYSLGLSATQVTDAGLAHFKDCKDLTELNLSQTQVGNPGLAHFKDCKSLKVLHLLGTQVTDAGLVYFENCKDLTTLNLAGTQVTEAGLAHFKDCKELTRLVIVQTQITDLSPLKGMPLKELDCDFQFERDAEILRSIKTLERINGKPAAEFWERNASTLKNTIGAVRKEDRAPCILTSGHGS